jgi:hypothetical protein
MPPDDQNADHINECDEQHLGGQRVAQTHRRLYGSRETLHLMFRHYVAFQELLNNWPSPLMHHKLRNNQQRQSNEEPNV